MNHLDQFESMVIMNGSGEGVEFLVTLEALAILLNGLDMMKIGLGILLRTSRVHHVDFVILMLNTLIKLET